MLYSEASYFDGYHFAHIAARNEHIRLEWLRKRNEAALRNTYNRLCRS